MAILRKRATRSVYPKLAGNSELPAATGARRTIPNDKFASPMFCSAPPTTPNPLSICLRRAATIKYSSKAGGRSHSFWPPNSSTALRVRSTPPQRVRTGAMRHCSKIAATSRCRIGLLKQSSIPAERQLSRSPLLAGAVKAMMGPCHSDGTSGARFRGGASSAFISGICTSRRMTSHACRSTHLITSTTVSRGRHEGVSRKLLCRPQVLGILFHGQNPRLEPASCCSGYGWCLPPRLAALPRDGQSGFQQFRLNNGLDKAVSDNPPFSI